MVVSGKNFKETSKGRSTMKNDSTDESTEIEKISDEINERSVRWKKENVTNELRESPKEIKDIFRQNRERNNRRRLKIVLEKPALTVLFFCEQFPIRS